MHLDSERDPFGVLLRRVRELLVVRLRKPGNEGRDGGGGRVDVAEAVVEHGLRF